MPCQPTPGIRSLDIWVAIFRGLSLVAAVTSVNHSFRTSDNDVVAPHLCAVTAQLAKAVAHVAIGRASQGPAHSPKWLPRCPVRPVRVPLFSGSPSC